MSPDLLVGTLRPREGPRSGRGRGPGEGPGRACSAEWLSSPAWRPPWAFQPHGALAEAGWAAASPPQGSLSAVVVSSGPGRPPTAQPITVPSRCVHSGERRAGEEDTPRAPFGELPVCSPWLPHLPGVGQGEERREETIALEESLFSPSSPTPWT